MNSHPCTSRCHAFHFSKDDPDEPAHRGRGWLSVGYCPLCSAELGAFNTRSLTSVIGQLNIPGIPFKPDVSISKISQYYRCHCSRIESRYKVSEGTESKSQLVAVESKPIIYIVPIWYTWFKLEPKSGTNCSECPLWIFGSFLCFSMAQTVQKGRKNVASGSRHRQADSSDSSPVPLPAKKKTATARKSTGGKPPSGRGRDEIESAGPRGGRRLFVRNCHFSANS
jgi:hypothetical protein